MIIKNKYLKSIQIKEHLESSSNKEDFLEKLKELDADFQEREMQDFVVELGKKKGFDITDDIKLISDSVESCDQTVRKRKNNEVKIEKLKKIQEDLATDLNKVTLEENNDKLNELLNDSIDQYITSLKETRTYNILKNYTFDEFLSYWECYDPQKEFRPNLFNKKIAFPNGTLSYIGARPHRGKSTALINLARESLLNFEKRVILCTFEMPPSVLIDNLILSMMCQSDIEKARQNIETRTTLPRQDLPEQKEKELYIKYIKNRTGTKSGNSKFDSYADEMFKKIKSLTTSGKLVVFDFIHNDFRSIKDSLQRSVREGDIVLIDYIQLVPAIDRKDEGYRRIQNISRNLFTLANDTNGIFISAAQFARGGHKNNFDSFDESSFRESGDLEQDAHNAIGIGWNVEDKTKLFFEILKARDSGAKGSAYHISANLEYCYIECGAIKEGEIDVTIKQKQQHTKTNLKVAMPHWKTDDGG